MLENSPAMQFTQDFRSELGTWPAEQNLHTVAPKVSEYLFALQVRHDDVPPTEYVEGWHDSQEFVVEEAYLPAPQ